MPVKPWGRSIDNIVVSCLKDSMQDATRLRASSEARRGIKVLLISSITEKL
jgi:hypothetical protein